MTSRQDKRAIRQKKGPALWLIFRQDLGAARTALLITAAAILLLSLALSRLARLPVDQEAETPPELLMAASMVDEDQTILGDMFTRYFEDIRFIQAVYLDTLPRAMERLKAGQIMVAIHLPAGFMSESVTGTPKQPVELWFNPKMQPEAFQVGVLMDQHAVAFDYLYSSIFGFQKLYVDLGGDEDQSWEKATAHTLNVVMTYLDRNRFTADTDLFKVNVLVHALSGLLVILSLLPAMGVLAATTRTRGTAYEDRLLMTCGYGPLMTARLLAGLVWWVLLLVPLLLALHTGGIAVSLFKMALLLLSLYLTAAFVMLTLGRIKAPGITLFQLGWLLVLFLLVMGGVLYPVSLFPVWLIRTARHTPVYPVMQTVYQALFDHAPMAVADLMPVLRSLVPAFILVLLLGRRRL